MPKRCFVCGKECSPTLHPVGDTDPETFLYAHDRCSRSRRRFTPWYVVALVILGLVYWRVMELHGFDRQSNKLVMWSACLLFWSVQMLSPVSATVERIADKLVFHFRSTRYALHFARENDARIEISGISAARKVKIACGVFVGLAPTAVFLPLPLKYTSPTVVLVCMPLVATYVLLGVRTSFKEGFVDYRSNRYTRADDPLEFWLNVSCRALVGLSFAGMPLYVLAELYTRA